MRLIDPSEAAKAFRAETSRRVAQCGQPLTLAGLLARDAAPAAVTYANYTRVGCEAVGIQFDLRRVDRLSVEAAIDQANAEPLTHGVIVYYPIFSVEHDRYIKDLVDPRKDIEGLNTYWARKLYHNERFVDAAKTKKSILPCTPLAIVKLLEAAGCFDPSNRSLTGKTIAIFNRSEVVGRPLANMLANDGATVYSFDIDGALAFRPGGVVTSCSLGRREALQDADVVITGVPSRDFPLITSKEIKAGAVCVNFSTLKNFADNIGERASVYIPRVGPMTVAMALRNTVRLYQNYQARAESTGFHS